MSQPLVLTAVPGCRVPADAVAGNAGYFGAFAAVRGRSANGELGVEGGSRRSTASSRRLAGWCCRWSCCRVSQEISQASGGQAIERAAFGEGGASSSATLEPKWVAAMVLTEATMVGTVPAA